MTESLVRQSAAGCSCLLLLIALLVLLPLSFQYLDYWQYGLKQRKTTGKVDRSAVFSQGRYFMGPDTRFFKFKADAHVVHLKEVDVFSNSDSEDSIGLSFKLDVDFTYFLKEEEVGILHEELALTYDRVVISRTTDAIKNTAANIPFDDYFRNRRNVEATLKQAVRDRWENPALHVALGQFHLGRIRIPDEVADKQLQAKIQVETNDKEQYLQNARLEREQTAVEVNEINLNRQKLLQTTEAEASLITANAVAEAEKIKADAINTGTLDLLTNLNLGSQEESTAYTYIRTLQNRPSLDLTVSYLSDSNLVKTEVVG